MKTRTAVRLRPGPDYRRPSFVVLEPETETEMVHGVIPYGPRTSMIFPGARTVTLEATPWPLEIYALVTAHYGGDPSSRWWRVVGTKVVDAFSPGPVVLDLANGWDSILEMPPGYDLHFGDVLELR